MPVHLVFFANAEWFFLSHRLPIALAAIGRGYRVSLLAPESKGMGEIVRSYGINFIPFELSRSGTNVLVESRTLRAVRRALRLLDPDILHNVTLKPVLYGTLAAVALRRKVHVVNAVSGLGSALVGGTSKRYLGMALPRAIGIAVRAASADLIVQNTEDRQLFLSHKLVRPERVHLILGSGVSAEPSIHKPIPQTAPPVVLFPARLLRDKGIIEFLAAARTIRGAGVAARFVVAGDLDPHNISSIDQGIIQAAVTAGDVEWIGYRSDILAVMTQAHIVALPSYREGFPKTLVEAMAVGRAIVTTDVAGCRDAVQHGTNGLLCPARDADALARSLTHLLEQPHLLHAFGQAGRARFERYFTIDQVVCATLDIYESSPRRSSPATGPAPGMDATRQ